MPTIEWKALPHEVKDHLLDRVRVREIAAQDLKTMLEWINTNPQVPEGKWCKDFGSFKLVGDGKLPKTFLRREQPCWGTKVQ